MLGPLVVVDGDRHVVLPRGHARALLALLALRAGEVVSTERLIDQLWGPTPPPTAAKALHGLVSILRRRLEPDRDRRARATVVETQAPGYVLSLDRDQVDAHRFRSMLAAAAGAPAAAKAARLREALELWRGPALDDFAYEPFAQAPIADLEESRLTALEERVEADLALNRHAELVAELEGLTAEHPLRERLRGQLMVALYRCGRQAEALKVYRDAQRLFVDELGIEPSPALQALQRSVLIQDPALDAPGATRLPRGASESARGDTTRAWLESGRKLVTVIFADLSPLVLRGADADPEATRPLVRRSYRTAVDVIERHGGAVEGFIGDVVVAVFGLPVAHEDDAARAVRAAVELRRDLGVLSQPSEREHGVRLAARIGINTGEVLVGDPTVAGTAASGPPVALAARLQQTAGEGEVLAGDDTRRLLHDDVVVEPVEPRMLDGQGRPLNAWRVLDTAYGARIARPGSGSPMLGREAELVRLHAALQRAIRDARASKLTVIGEPGIGKSRLAAEFADRVRSRADALTGHCPSYGEGITFLPLREMVFEVARDKDRNALRDAVGSADVAEQVAGAVGLTDTPERPDALFPAFRRCFEALARRRPLVLVFEDVHWAQPTLLDLLEYLSGSIRGRVMLLCLARPELLEQRPAWSERSQNADALLLQPLGEDQVDQLVIARSSGGTLPVETSKRIVELARGNPLFAEQLVAALHDERTPSIPPTVQALLVARLDRLGPAERDVIRSASVLGDRFGVSALLALLPEEAAPSAARHLETLRRKELLVATEDAMLGGKAFAFRHVLIQLAAYGTLTKAARARLHEQVADWMETEARQTTEFEEVIGYHLERAHGYRRGLGGDDAHSRALATRAGNRLTSAGLRAYGRFDVAAAANLFSRASALLPKGHPQRLRVRRHLAEAHQVLGRHDQAATLLSEMLGEIEDGTNPTVEAAIRLEQARVRLFTGPDPTPLRAIRETAERARAAFEAAGDEAGLAQSCYILGLVHQCRGETNEMEKIARQGLAHADRSAEPREEVQARVNLAEALTAGDTPVPDCIVACEELAPWRGMQHPMILCELAVLKAMRGDFDHARELVARGRLLLAERIRGRRPLMFAAHASASVEHLAGDVDAAERELRTALQMAREMHEREWVSRFAAALCRLPTIHRSPEAEELSSLSATTAPAENLPAQALSRMAIARLLATREERGTATGLAREAVRLVPPSMLTLGADLRVDLAEIMIATRQRQAALPVLAEAISLYERKGDVVRGRHARALRASTIPPTPRARDG
jgi:DNA-binding SARP family transcriptional activator/tetratricopeptide (TPR) repeat protein